MKSNTETFLGTIVKNGEDELVFSKSSAETADKMLIEAIEAGNLAGIKGALMAGANPNTGTFTKTRSESLHGQGYTTTTTTYVPALIQACEKGPDAINCVRELLNAGADPKAVRLYDGKPDINAFMAVAIACVLGGSEVDEKSGELIDLLHKSGADIKHLISGYDCNVLFLCLARGIPHYTTPGAQATSVVAMQKFIELDADVKCVGVARWHNKNGESGISFTKDILTATIQCGEFDMAKVIVEAGANVNPKNVSMGRYEDNPISICFNHFITDDELDMIEYLLEKEASPHSRYNDDSKEGIDIPTYIKTVAKPSLERRILACKIELAKTDLSPHNRGVYEKGVEEATECIARQDRLLKLVSDAMEKNPDLSKAKDGDSASLLNQVLQKLDFGTK